MEDGSAGRKKAVVPEKKGRLRGAGGPSLGRKRPKRAAEMRGTCIAALQQSGIAAHKMQGETPAICTLLMYQGCIER
jgi:hypothetical protein